ncbi:MAG: SDR family oxidoreductase, partial [Propionibacteriaceae bacterium]|nr:SDR family oxidoreductase [Propionibacteriaceae bacterium]
MSFQGTTALVVGAATGIGRATALAFAEAGANLALADIDERMTETADLARDLGANVTTHPVDVRLSASVRTMVAQVAHEHGRIHVAFNNAGIMPPRGRLADATDEEWERVIQVDLSGVFHCLREQIRHMVGAGGGSIINTASIAGIRSGDRLGTYAAAKHGVVGLTKAAAVDYAPDGVRVNAVAPGLIRTPMTDAWFADPEQAAA